MKILLSHIMCQRRLSMMQVSKLTGIPKTTIFNIMYEKRSPRMDTMEELAIGLRVGIEDLYDSKYKTWNG